MALFFRHKPGPVHIRPAIVTDAPALARLHGPSFAHPWSALTFESLISERSVSGHVAEERGIVGFILTRSAADEAEVLSIAVETQHRKAGIGRRLLQAELGWLARRGTATVFLEVEAGNAPALAIYHAAGFVAVGSRPGYYRAKDGSRHDAVMMRVDLGGRRFDAPIPDA